MAVTGAIFEKLIFGGVDSSLYGIYITGEAVYNAPKRAVEMVSVPGRNGAVAIDQGYWENITVTYPAGTFADDQTDFADAVSAFRNALASQIGYQRLEDTYHPDEYRMAMFVDGVEVAPANRNEAGQFNITFNCKPQRWLKSGETAVTVSAGDTLTNPTLYGASPLLVLDGYGNVSIGSQTINVLQAELGTITVCNDTMVNIPRGTGGARVTATITLDTSNLMTGDTITLGRIRTTDTNGAFDGTVSVTNTANLNGASVTWQDGKPVTIWFDVPAGDTLTYGTAETIKHSAALMITESGGTYVSGEKGPWLIYDGGSTLSIRVYINSWAEVEVQVGEITADSSKVVIETTYIDLDIGEAYWIQSGQVVDANNNVSLGSDLPVLEPGANTITYDSTITNLEITPRWWQL